MIELLKEFYAGKAKPASGGGGSSDYSDLENKPQINDVTLSGNKAASDLGLQDTLVSGINIKTINNESILGSGNLVTHDPNTYRSLSSAQATTLLSDGTYNGEAVANGEIFTSADGAFKEFGDVQTPGGVKSTNPGTTYLGSFGRSYDSFKGWPFFYSEGFRFTKTNGDSWLPAVHSDMYIYSRDDTTMYIYPSDINSTAGYKTTDAENWTSCTVAARPSDKGVSYYAAGNFILCGKYAEAQNSAFIYTDNIESYWNTATLPAGVSNYFILPFSDRLCILDKATSKLYSTTDFQNWTDEGTSDVGDLSNSYCKAWVANDKAFVLLQTSSKFKVSSNYGKSFTEATMTPANGSGFRYLVLCGYCSETGVYVAFERNPSYSTYGNYYHTSVDGLDWTLINCSSTPYSARYPSSSSALQCCGSEGAFSGAGLAGGGAAFSIIETGIHHDYSLTPLSYNKTQVDTVLSDKQDTLTAGTGIDITGNVISATGGSGGSVTLSDIAIAGEGITFDNANYENLGGVTVTNGVASGFASYKAILTNYTFSPSSNPWKINFSMIPGSSGGDQNIFVRQGAEFSSVFIALNSLNHIMFYLASGDIGYWDINSSAGTATYTAGTKYYCEAGFTGSKYYFKYKAENDTEWTTDFEVSSSTSVGSTQFALGCGYKGYAGTYVESPFAGSLDLNDLSIEIDGTVTYRAISDKTTISADIGSGDYAPTSSTEGYVGKLYITSGGAVYICTGVSGSTYTWNQITLGVALSGNAGGSSN